MQSIVTHILSLMGAASIVSLLIAVMLLLHMIQQAFARSGIVWGVIASLYPAGTYIYCRKNWDMQRGKFLTVCVLLAVTVATWAVLKVVS